MRYPTQIRLGVSGFGYAARSIMPAILSHQGVELVAIADPNLGVHEEQIVPPDVVWYADPMEMIASDAMDAIYVASPHQFHARQALSALQMGKHVLIEKPMALTLEDCRAIQERSRQTGRVVIVGHTHAFDPPIRLMQETIASGAVGRVALVHSFVYTDWLYRPRTEEELCTRQGGGVIFNQAPHQIDIVRLLAGGSLHSIRAHTLRLDPSRPTEGGYLASMHFDNGVIANAVYSGHGGFLSDEWNDWRDEEGMPSGPERLGASRRRLADLSRDQEIAWKKYRHLEGTVAHEVGTGATFNGLPHFGSVIVTGTKGDLRSTPYGAVLYDARGAVHLPVPRSPNRPIKYAVIDDFVEAIAGHRDPTHDAAWGTKTMEACFAILASDRDEAEIPLTL